jgi:hypothetical protein
MLVGGKREGREGGKSINPSTPAQGLLSGIPYAGWWRVRGKGREESCPSGKRKTRAFEIHGVSSLYIKASIQFPPTCFHQMSLEQASGRLLSFKSSVFLRALSSTPA